MRRHAKVPSAGSTEGSGKSRGLFRRAFAVRAASTGSKESGAPSSRRSRLLLATAATLALALILGVTFASAVVPTVSVEDASAVKASTAHAEGEVDPQGQSTTYRFQYATQADFSDAATAKEETIEGGKQTVEAGLTALTPNTTYHLRLVAENGDGPSEAVAASTFTTEAVSPPTVVSIADASDVSITKAKVSGVVSRPVDADPAANVECRFEYVSELEFQSRNDRQKLFVRAKGGLFALLFNGELTGEIPFNATAAQVREALEALGGIGAGDVTVTGGPGNETASSPYLIEFTGTLAGQDVGQLGTEGSELLGPDPSAAVQTTADGHPEEGFNRASTTFCIGNPLESPGTSTVEAELTGLMPSMAYHLRLSAHNGGGADTLMAADTFTTLVAPPPTISLDPVVDPGATSVNATSQINPNGTPTRAWFEYSANNGATWQPTPFGDADIPGPIWCLVFGGGPYCYPELEGNSPLAFNRTINERNVNYNAGDDALPLEPNTNYLLRVHAENLGGVSVSSTQSFKTDPVPVLAQTLSAGTTAEGATLSGRINPKNSLVTYQFEWGVQEGADDESYEHLAPATAEQLPATGNAFRTITASITGLEPETVYHFRIIVNNTDTGEVVKGANQQFTTQPSPSAPEVCPNESSRVGASAGLPNCRVYEFVTPDFNTAYLTSQPRGQTLADGSAIAFGTIDAPDDAESSPSPIQTVVSRNGPKGWSVKSLEAPLPVPVGGYHTTAMMGVSPNFSEIVVMTDQPLAGPNSPAGINYYLRRADGTFIAMTTVGASENGAGSLAGFSRDFSHLFFTPCEKQLSEDPVESCPGNVYEWADGDLRLLGVLPGPEHTLVTPRLASGVLPAVSDDGRQVLFASFAAPGLYLRTDGESTVDVSLSQRSIDPGVSGGGKAVGVTGDGSTILFTSGAELTKDAYTGETEGVPNHQGADLYSYDVESGVLTDLTVGDQTVDAATGANVTEVVGASRDGSYIYFLARGSLTDGAISGNEKLYVVHDGQVDFISNEVFKGDGGVPFYVTPNGKFAAFVSKGQLTGYDSAGKTEVYKYSYGRGLDCASCRPDGSPAVGGAGIVGRAITDDGSQVFFESADAIVPEATSSGIGRIYQYENGKVSLLSPGDAESRAVLLDASASGDDVFFATYGELTPDGQGTVNAVYDARVNADTFRPTAPECQGEGCRTSGTAASGAASLGSASFDAPGEVTVPRSRAAKAKALMLRVAVPEAGQLTVSGKGIRPVQKNVAKAGPVTLTLTLKPGANKTRLSKGVFRTKVQVLFKPKSGSVSRSAGARPVVSLTFEDPPEKGGK